MSYEKAMRWNKKHPKGTKQTLIMHTESGFQPSLAFLDSYFEYRAECEAINMTPASCHEYYCKTRHFNKILRDKQTNHV